MSLRERREVVELYRGAPARDVGVLFSVVRVAGSSYRQAGAHMLQLPGGVTAGTLSGGCLEADLLRRAAWTVRNGAVLEHFSTAFDDTADLPYGLGCGGEIDVLAEPLNTPEADALLRAMEGSLQHTGRTVVTLLPQGESQSLRRIVLDGNGDVDFASDALPTEDIAALRRLALRWGTDTPGWIETPLGAAAIEPLRPVQRLIIFGAGEDSRPLARMAGEMGWFTVVVDTRAQRASDGRFPGSHTVVAAAAHAVPVQPADAVVLMTHSYTQDRALLAELLAAPPAYLGLLGARHRSALLLQEASVLAGISLEQALAATHAPVGLRLGGEGPEAISLAVVAEVQQVLAGVELKPARRMTAGEVSQLVRGGPAAAVYSHCALHTEALPQ